MPIIRSRHQFDDAYTRIPNAWIRDQNLSLKAKGLLAQILSHQPGWQLSINALAETNGCGRDAIRAAINELESWGYLTREQERAEGGKFSDVVWVTHDPADSPVSDKPVSENPTTANPTTKKTNHKEDQIKENIRSTEVEQAFNEFWDAYPKKVNKIKARKTFQKLWPQIGQELIVGAKRLRDDPNLPALQYVPYPQSWLNAGGWLNEPYPERVLTAQEKAEKEKQVLLEREAARRAEQDRLDREIAERNKNYVPATRCEHGHVQAVCKICSNFKVRR